MFNKTQFRDLIGRVLTHIGLYTDSAVELLMLTAAVETQLGTYLEQIKGPAKGIFQIEPRTEKDIWDRFLSKKPELFNKIKSLRPEIEIKEFPDLETDIDYQIALARIYYYRIPTKLPLADDVIGLAQYWKKYYNTYLGKGTVEKAVDAYNKYAKK